MQNLKKYVTILSKEGEILADFKERLELALANKKMTAAELSRLSGINEGAISQYRKGAYKATQENLEKLALTLGVSIAWLMGADVPMKKEKSSPDLSEEEKGLLELFRSLSEDKQKMALEMLKAALSTK